MRCPLHVTLGGLAAMLLAVSAGAAPNWGALVPGRWEIVSENSIADVDPCPSRDCSYSAVEGVAGLIDDWCGGTFASGVGPLGSLLAWGGGHGGYFGSEIYAFDLATGRWARVTEPYDDGSPSIGAACNADGIYPDGSPCPAHTYDKVEYHPPTNSFVILSGTDDPRCGGCDDARAHRYSFTSGAWTLGARRPVPGAGTGATTALDPARGVIWLLSCYGQSFSSYDPSTDTWTDYGAPQVLEIDGIGVVDPIRDLYVFVDARGSGLVYAIPLAAPDTGLLPLTTAGDTAIQSREKLGMDWDPVGRRFVAWDDGADVYALDPPTGDWRTGTWTWTRVPPDPGNAVIPFRNMNGTYGRFRYAPAVDAFVLVSSVDGPTWAYRISPACSVDPAEVDPSSVRVTKLRSDVIVAFDDSGLGGLADRFNVYGLALARPFDRPAQLAGGCGLAGSPFRHAGEADAPGNRAYLVAAACAGGGGARESSYGRDSMGAERPRAAAPCP